MMTQQQLLEPNPPQWPASVKIFYPHHDPKTIMEQIKETEDDMEVDPTKTKTVPSGMTYTSSNHFTTNRWALLFAPGIYEGVDFEVGYYVQVLGLGANAQDVRFTKCRKGPFVPALNKFDVR